jgi:hypothetical protein
MKRVKLSEAAAAQRLVSKLGVKRFTPNSEASEPK